MPSKRNKNNKSKPAATKSKPYGGRRHRFLKWMLTERKADPDQAHYLALMLAFLVAGILTYINTDRLLHAESSKEIGPRVSQHGWPMIYLSREAPKPELMLRKKVIYDWPVPAVEGESRSFSWLAMVVDVLVALLIVIAVYWGTRRLAGNTSKTKVEDESLLKS